MTFTETKTLKRLEIYPVERIINVLYEVKVMKDGAVINITTDGKSYSNEKITDFAIEIAPTGASLADIVAGFSSAASDEKEAAVLALATKTAEAEKLQSDLAAKEAELAKAKADAEAKATESVAAKEAAATALGEKAAELATAQGQINQLQADLEAAKAQIPVVDPLAALTERIAALEASLKPAEAAPEVAQ